MLRQRYGESTHWEELLPVEERLLPRELARRTACFSTSRSPTTGGDGEECRPVPARGAILATDAPPSFEDALVAVQRLPTTSSATNRWHRNVSAPRCMAGSVEPGNGSYQVANGPSLMPLTSAGADTVQVVALHSSEAGTDV
jgi:hypothetical protein